MDLPAPPPASFRTNMLHEQSGRLVRIFDNLLVVARHVLAARA